MSVRKIYFTKSSRSTFLYVIKMYDNLLEDFKEVYQIEDADYIIFKNTDYLLSHSDGTAAPLENKQIKENINLSKIAYEYEDFFILHNIKHDYTLDETINIIKMCYTEDFETSKIGRDLFKNIDLVKYKKDIVDFLKTFTISHKETWQEWVSGKSFNNYLINRVLKSLSKTEEL